MDRIASFGVDHERLGKGVYLSRVDGDIKTVDVRMREPYKDRLLSNAQLHSLEHLLATVLRNGKNKEKVVYVGPMGCQTGFYVLFKDLSDEEIVKEIVSAFKTVVFSGLEMPGNSKSECGNCLNLSCEKARSAAKPFYEIIKDKTRFDAYTPNNERE